MPNILLKMDDNKYSIFQPMYRYFAILDSGNGVSGWKSKALGNKIFKPPTTSDCNLNPGLT